jgi:uncharacterized protein with NAD-binding domain and iron-sulfur cluster
LRRAPHDSKCLQPSSLRHALELCKEHARIKRNRSVEGIAELMGLADHWSLYKYFQSGRMPVNLVPPFEAACGIDYVTRWMATTAGKLLVDMPSGRNATPAELVEVNSGCAAALLLLTNFYASPQTASAEDTLAALAHHLGQVAYHHSNVQQHSTPEFDFSPTGSSPL